MRTIDPPGATRDRPGHEAKYYGLDLDVFRLRPADLDRSALAGTVHHTATHASVGA